MSRSSAVRSVEHPPEAPQQAQVARRGPAPAAALADPPPGAKRRVQAAHPSVHAVRRGKAPSVGQPDAPGMQRAAEARRLAALVAYGLPPAPHTRRAGPHDLRAFAHLCPLGTRCRMHGPASDERLAAGAPPPPSRRMLGQLRRPPEARGAGRKLAPRHASLVE